MAHLHCVQHGYPQGRPRRIGRVSSPVLQTRLSKIQKKLTDLKVSNNLAISFFSTFLLGSLHWVPPRRGPGTQQRSPVRRKTTTADVVLQPCRTYYNRLLSLRLTRNVPTARIKAWLSYVDPRALGRLTRARTNHRATRTDTYCAPYMCPT